MLITVQCGVTSLSDWFLILSLTPKGVDHICVKFVLMNLGLLILSLTPKGVDHPMTQSPMSSLALELILSLTPKGVDHVAILPLLFKTLP